MNGQLHFVTLLLAYAPMKTRSQLTGTLPAFALQDQPANGKRKSFSNENAQQSASKKRHVATPRVSKGSLSPEQQQQLQAQRQRQLELNARLPIQQAERNQHQQELQRAELLRAQHAQAQQHAVRVQQQQQQIQAQRAQAQILEDIALEREVWGAVVHS